MRRVIPSRHRRSRAFALLALAALGLAACSSSSSSSTAATVGDAEISNSQLARDADLYAFVIGLSDGECGTPVAGETQDAACARLALSNDIREQVVKAYATENDLSVEQAAIDDAMVQVEQGVGGPEELDARLADAGLTRAHIEALARRLLLFNVVLEDVVADRLDEETLRAAYEEQLGTFTTVEVAHILVEDQADAERIASEVTPETFARVAERESIDTTSGANGGSLGSFSETGFQAQFIPVFVEAALALEAGEISAPVQSEFGWHVIHLVRRDVAAFEDVRDQLQADRSTPVFDDWFREQVEAAEIDVNPRFGRYDLESLEVVPIRSTADEPAGETAPVATGP
jgi:parvulin-like peptidyl-prolyl isomerase